jgi:hypothetical protein
MRGLWWLGLQRSRPQCRRVRVDASGIPDRPSEAVPLEVVAPGGSDMDATVLGFIGIRSLSSRRADTQRVPGLPEQIRCDMGASGLPLQAVASPSADSRQATNT